MSRWVALAVLILASMIVAGSLLLEPSTSASSADSVKDNNSVTSAAPNDELDAPTIEHVVASTARETKSIDQARIASLNLSDQELARLKRRQELEQAADKRFNQTVSTDGLKAEDVPLGVRKMFRTITLVPVFNTAEGRKGYIDGMRIAQLARANPFSTAGFRRGDRLVIIDGLPLRDPAEIAQLFANLSSQFEVCADRKTGRFCRFVSI